MISFPRELWVFSSQWETKDAGSDASEGWSTKGFGIDVFTNHKQEAQFLLRLTYTWAST